jgi:hypothetical protein
MFPNDLARAQAVNAGGASHSQGRGERPELADSWFNQPALSARARSSRPPPPDPIDDPLADAWFV